MKKLLIFLSTIYSLVCNAQIPPSPNVASLFKLESSNINESNGSLNLTIPIYQIDIDGLILPISLNYDSKGVIIEEESGCLGTSWGLKIGGVVNRDLFGEPDELHRAVFFDQLEPSCTTARSVSGVNWASNSEINNVVTEYFKNHNGNLTNYNGPSFSNIIIGKEPDVFNYILPTGRRGSFMFSSVANINDLGIVSSTNDRIFPQVEILPNETTGALIGFLIFDEFGNQFFFETVETRYNSYWSTGFGFFGSYDTQIPFLSLWWGPISNPFSSNINFCHETPVDYYTSSQGWFDVFSKPITTSWHISKIITNKNNVINFTYEDENHERLTGLSHVFKDNLQPRKYINSNSENIFKTKRLTKIETPGEKIFVNYKTSNREDVRVTDPADDFLKACESIIVKDKKDKVIKKVDFVTSYKVSPGIDDVQNQQKYLFKRLWLDKVIVNDSEVFDFFYNENNLPHKFSFEQDYWGYYNGNEANQTGKTMIPDLWYYPDDVKSYSKPNKFSIFKRNNFVGQEIKLSEMQMYSGNLANYLSDRSSNLEKLNHGMLQKVVYPTRGYHLFEYELNDFIYEGIQRKGFGLRVKKMSMYDSDDTLVSSFDYEYKDVNGNSSGMITNLPSFGKMSSVKLANGVSTFYNMYSSNSFSDNCNIFYERIQKNILNGGKVVSEFLVPIKMDTENALNHNGEYIYKKNFDIAKRVIDCYPISNDCFQEYPFNHVEYPVFSLSKNYDNLFGNKTKEYIYSSNEDVLQMTENEYELSFKSKKYDYFMGATDYMFAGNRIHDSYIKTNIFADFLLKKTSNTYYNSNGNLVNSNEYTYYNNNLIKSIIKSDSKNQITIEEYKYPEHFMASKMITTPEVSYEIHNIYKIMNFNHRLNYPIEVVRKMNDKVISASLNNYSAYSTTTSPQVNYGLFLVSSIMDLNINKAIDDFVVTQPSLNFSLPGSNEMIFDDRMKTGMVFHNYDIKGNLLEFSKTDDIRTVYIWGYNKTKVIAKIENASYTDILSTTIANIQNLSDADNDNCKASTCKEQLLRNELNNLRDTLPKAMVTTYTYDPLIGITSMTDSRGQTTYYSYDTMNRLKEIKDANGNLVNDYKYHYKD